jgi:hypothetical protein
MKLNIFIIFARMKQTKLYCILLCYPIDNTFNNIIKDIKIKKNCRYNYYYSIDGIDIFTYNKGYKSLYVKYYIWNMFNFNENFSYQTLDVIFKYLFRTKYNLELETAYTFNFYNISLLLILMSDVIFVSSCISFVNKLF